jgi:HK97 family phage major capsid protein
VTTVQRIASYQTNVEVNLKAGELVRAVRVLAIAGVRADAQRLAERFSCSQGFQQIINKAAVPAATTLDSTWAGPLVSLQLTAPEAFVASLRDFGAFDRMLDDMVRAPVNTRLAVVSSGATGASPNEADAKLIGRLTIGNADLLPVKSLAILVLSREILRMGGSGADNLIRRELAAAVATAVDTAFVTALTTGITSIPSQGATALGVRQDLRALVDNVNTGARSRLYLLANSTIGKRLAVLGTFDGAQVFPGANASTGGLVAGIPLIITDGISAIDLMLVDAAQVAASSAVVEFDESNHALLNMSDSPDSPPVAGTTYTNLWQENLTAVKATRYWAVKRLATTAVAVVSNVTATGNSPA